MKALILRITVLVLAVTACDKPSEQVTKNDYSLIEGDHLSQAFILNSSATFKGYFYNGSEDEYHYFKSDWDYESTRYFKLKKSDISVNNPIGLVIKK